MSALVSRAAASVTVKELARLEDRVSFLYVDRCALHADKSGLMAVTETREKRIPAAVHSVLWLGPGTTVTHSAIAACSRLGMSLVWTGDDGLAFYSHARPLSRTSVYLSAQAAIHADPKKRMRAAVQMYRKRFPEGPPSSANTLAKLRSAEGTRMKARYRECSKAAGVPWNGRVYVPGDLDQSDAVNKALSIAHQCLYAVTLGVVTGLGLHPGLGVVHNGTQESFVYDIADLYKSDTSVPLAFQVVATAGDVSTSVLSHIIRTSMRSEMLAQRIVPGMIRDIKELLTGNANHVDTDVSENTLWSPDGDVAGGRDHSEVCG